MKYLLTLVLISAICLIACYKEESNKYANQANSLNFTKTEVSNGVVFNWDESTISNFTEYVVTKHTVSTAAMKSAVDLNKLSSINIVARIKNRQISNAKDSTSIADTYYRLYAVSGSQFFASDEIVQNSNFYPLANQSVSQYLIDHRKGHLYLFQPPNLIEIVQLSSLKKLALFTNSVILSSYSMSLGYDQNGNTEIYSSTGNKILVVDGGNLRIKDTIYNIPIGKEILNTVTDENSNIFFTESNAVSKYDPVTMKITKIGGIGLNHDVLKVSKNGAYVFTGSNISDIYQFSIDQTSGIVSLVKSPVFIDFSDKNSTLANSEPTIVCGANGAIYTKNFQIKKNLANEVGGYLKSIFDINDEFIYAIGSSQKVIYKFENREGYKNISRIHVSINVKDIFDYSGQIFMIGNSIDPQTGSSKLFLQRIIL
jgi:hypothetical protein